MKHVIISLLLVGGGVALTATEASAAVCAAGVYRAGVSEYAVPRWFIVLWSRGMRS
jgi:hypothetical protein